MKKSIFKSIISVLLAVSILFSLSVYFAVYAEERSGYVIYDSVRVRTSPSTVPGEANKLKVNGSTVMLNTGDPVTVLEIVDSPNDTKYKKWCHIKFKYGTSVLEGYIFADWVHINESSGNVTVPDDIPDIYKPYIEELLKIHPNWKFVIYDTGYDWNSLFSTDAQGFVGRSLIPYTSPLSYRSTASGCYDWRTDKWIVQDAGPWYQANSATIAYYMDPRNFLTEKYVFMFESLSYDSSTQNLDGVSNILNGSFMENAKIKNTNGESVSYSQAYIDAAVYSNVSPYHLASRTVQEVGKNGSGSTSGTYSGYEGYYNFYNIGASQGSNPIANGLNFAKTGGSMSEKNKANCLIPWNSQYRSILGGGYWIGMSYINSVHKQNTLYYQKFNTSNPNNAFYHQYMGNIMAPSRESTGVMSTYTELGIIDNSFTFVIPYYRNMPTKACELPKSSNLNPNNWLSALSVEGYESDIDFDAAKTSGYTITVPYNVSSVKISAKPVNSKATVTGTGNISLNSGSNKIDIKVKAENGDVRTYTVNIVRNNSVPLTSISLSKTSTSIIVGDSQTLSVIYNPSGTTDDKTVTWTSSNSNVATVSNTGKVTAKGIGEAVITAKVGNHTATCKVTVSNVKLGDVNGDGNIAILDAYLIYEFLSGKVQPTELQKIAADVDGKNGVTITDAFLIFKKISGEINEF